MTGLLRIDRPGLFSVVQDAGRAGMQYAGIPVGGPLDRRAARLLNELLQNPEDTPVIEITLAGPQITILKDCQLAVCGADLSFTINGEAAEMYCPIEVGAGSILRFGKVRAGCRAYIGVRGIWIHPHWMQSVAPIPAMPEILAESILRRGQVLHILPLSSTIIRKAAPLALPEGNAEIRVLQGPELDTFTPLAVADFFGKTHLISPASNRMGYRLQDSLRGLRSTASMLSSGLIPGTIQVPPSGAPIILLADAQTVGGYPRIAQVADEDLDVLGQLKPGDSIRFLLI